MKKPARTKPGRSCYQLPRFGMRTLLERAGFRIRSAKRADCAHCTGNSTGTVSFTSEVAYCHRCHWTANAVTLAMQLGLGKRKGQPAKKLSPEEQQEDQQRIEREAQIAAFEAWHKAKTDEVYRELLDLGRCKILAREILATDPESEFALNLLAHAYHNEARVNQTLDFLMCLKTSEWLGDDNVASLADVFQLWRDLGAPGPAQSILPRLGASLAFAGEAGD